MDETEVLHQRIDHLVHAGRICLGLISTLKSVTEAQEKEIKSLKEQLAALESWVGVPQ